jgi:hypothetical protein
VDAVISLLAGLFILAIGVTGLMFPRHFWFALKSPGKPIFTPTRRAERDTLTGEQLLAARLGAGLLLVFGCGLLLNSLGNLGT